MKILRALLVLVGLVGLAPLCAETPEETFDRGNSAYEQEDFAAAAEAYRSVLRYGITDPIVEYNLGNAEFRAGNLGRAIVHFERARRLAPVDRDILANLEFARSFCYERVEPETSVSLLGWLSTLQDRLGTDRQAWVLLGLVWITGAVILAGFARPRGWRAAHGWILALVLAAIAGVGSSWYVTHERLTGTRAAVVLDEVVEILAGPGPNHPTLVTVHEGLILEIRAERQEWLQVGLPNGLNGWIVRSAVEPV